MKYEKPYLVSLTGKNTQICFGDCFPSGNVAASSPYDCGSGRSASGCFAGASHTNSVCHSGGYVNNAYCTEGATPNIV